MLGMDGTKDLFNQYIKFINRESNLIGILNLCVGMSSTNTDRNWPLTVSGAHKLCSRFEGALYDW